MNRNLLISTYHWIKHNPEHWDQERWRCGTGMCFAGWAVSIAGLKWSRYDDEYLCDYVSLDGETVFCPIAARELLGLDAVHYAQERFSYPLDHPLFGQDNTLDDIRRILTDLLGQDPEELAPDEDLILAAKRFAAEQW